MLTQELFSTLVGKTVREINYEGGSYANIYFTDGTSLEIHADAYEERSSCGCCPGYATAELIFTPGG